MIQEAFNGMITLLLAKFMLNDIPHAILSNTSQERRANDAEPQVASITPQLMNMLATRGSRDLRTVILGYYRIARGEATVQTVDNVAQSIVRGLDHYARISDWAPLTPGQVLEETGHTADYVTLRYGDRSAKVIVIEKIIHSQHGGGLLLGYMFPKMDWEMQFAVEEFLDRLAAGEGGQIV